VIGAMTRELRDGERVNYKIIRHNFATGESSRIAVVRGQSKAEVSVDSLERKLAPTEKAEGWRYFLERTTDPVTGKKRKRKANLKPGRSKARSR
jgi:hypothetical protein